MSYANVPGRSILSFHKHSLLYRDKGVPADGATAKVDHSEEAAAVDLKTNDAEAGDTQHRGDAVKAETKTGDGSVRQPISNSDAAAPKDAKAPETNDKDQGKKGADKLEDIKKEAKETVVDVDLLHAFRYFDKTGDNISAMRALLFLSL